MATEALGNLFIVTTDHAGVSCIVSCTRLMAPEAPLMCDVFHALVVNCLKVLPKS